MESCLEINLEFVLVRTNLKMFSRIRVVHFFIFYFLFYVSLIFFLYMLLGMGDSIEFAGELYDAMARRRNIDAEDGLTKDQVRDFWEEMTKKDLDARLSIFFDM